MTIEQPVESHIEFLDRLLDMPEFQFDAVDIAVINELKKDKTTFENIRKFQYEQTEADQKKQIEASVIDTENRQKKAALIVLKDKMIHKLKDRHIQATNDTNDRWLYDKNSSDKEKQNDKEIVNMGINRIKRKMKSSSKKSSFKRINNSFDLNVSRTRTG